MWATLPESIASDVLAFLGGRRLHETFTASAASFALRALANVSAREHLRSPYPAMRLEALEPQIRLAERGLPPALHNVLACAGDEDAEVRKTVAKALSYLVHPDDEEAPTVLAEALRMIKDQDDSVRKAGNILLVSVARRQDDAVVAALIGIAGDADGSVHVCQEVVGVLGTISGRGHSQALGFVRACVGSTCLEVQREAIAALSEVAERGDESVVSLLCESMADPDMIIRCAAIVSCSVLAPTGHEEAVRSLVRALEDRWQSVRLRALVALGAVAATGDAAATSAVALLLEDVDSEVKCAAERISAKLQGPAPEEQDAL
mmetsp:Transcript_14774/g.51786  ORF Transcript_14774/g.51786 Transcript_14774/m.51786 type:complete len:320 (-) Transcript_14774:102-1061(-)